MINEPNKKAVALLVEDDRMQTYMMSLRLEQKNCEVVAKENGFEAKEFLLSEEQKIYIAIVGLGCPIMTGDELLAWMKSEEKFKEIPVLMISADFPESVDDIEKCMDLGAFKCVSKPLKSEHIEELLNHINKLNKEILPKDLYFYQKC